MVPGSSSALSASKTACALICTLVLSACASPIRTEHDSDPQADFTKYQSFAWISEDPLMGPNPRVAGGEYISPIEEQRIRSAVDADLLAKGYRRAESLESADLVVSFTVGSQQKVRTQTTPGRSDTYYSAYGGGAWYGGSTVRTYTYIEGTLALEFIQRAVTAVLEKFPASSGS